MHIPLQVIKDNGIPIYLQIKEQIRLMIRQGRLRAQDVLPTVEEVSTNLDVNRNTVSRVYRELQREGMLELKRGIGTYVSTTKDMSIPSSKQDRLNQQIDALLVSAKRFQMRPVELYQLIQTRWKSP